MAAHGENDVEELRSEIVSLRLEIRDLKAAVEQIRSEVTPTSYVDASHIRPGGLQLSTKQHHLFNRYGSLKEAILHLLSQHEAGLSVAEITSKLSSEWGLSIKPNTPSSVLYRLKRDGLVSRNGRTWVRSSL